MTLNNRELSESELDSVSAAGSHHHHHKEHGDSNNNVPDGASSGGTVEKVGYDLARNRAI